MQGARDTGNCREVLSSQWPGMLSDTEAGAHMFIPFPRVPGGLFVASTGMGWPGPSETHTLPLLLFPNSCARPRSPGDRRTTLFPSVGAQPVNRSWLRQGRFRQGTVGLSSECLLTEERSWAQGSSAWGGRRASSLGGKVRLRPPVLEVLPRCSQAVGRWEGRGPAGPMGAGMGRAPSTGSSSPHRLPSSPFGCRKPTGLAGASRTPLAQQRVTTSLASRAPHCACPVRCLRSRPGWRSVTCLQLHVLIPVAIVQVAE